MERFGGLAGKAPAALVQQKSHQTRAAKAASRSREPAAPVFPGKGKKLLKIPPGTAQLPF